jgi:hypothetical protein
MIGLSLPPSDCEVLWASEVLEDIERRRLRPPKVTS